MNEQLHIFSIEMEILSRKKCVLFTADYPTIFKNQASPFLS